KAAAVYKGMDQLHPLGFENKHRVEHPYIQTRWDFKELVVSCLPKKRSRKKKQKEGCQRLHCLKGRSSNIRRSIHL
ncbi:MAG: hypothetical protein ACJAXD_002061, partial [Cryomorphaceae bacterium]